MTVVPILTPLAVQEGRRILGEKPKKRWPS